MIGSARVAIIAGTRIGYNLLSCIIKHAFESLKILVMFFSVRGKRRLLSEDYARKERGTGGEGAYGREYVVSCNQRREPWLYECLLGYIRASSVVFFMANCLRMRIGPG